MRDAIHSAVSRLVQDGLERWAARQPEKVALVADGHRWTYGELNGHAEGVARWLAARGVRAGDRVVIFLDNCAETVIAFHGALKAGATFVIVAGTLKATKLRYILQNCKARALITHTGKAAVVGEALAGGAWAGPIVWDGPAEDLPAGPAAESVRWGDVAAAGDGGPVTAARAADTELAALVYTSGSTGEPKGVMCPHRCMLSAANSIVEYLGNRESDIVLNVLPLSFSYGLYQVLAMFLCGGTLILERSFAYLHPLLKRIAEEKVTGFAMVPSIAAMLLQLRDMGQYDLGSVRYMTNAGAAMPPDYIRRLRSLLPHVQFFLMYGLTECVRVCFLPPGEVDRRPSSVGHAMPNCEAWVADEDGREAGPGEVGELVVRGPNVMQGYCGDPELTDRMFIPGADGRRVLHTGDLFKRDEEGFLYFVARKDDMIKTRGERVSPKEVEEAICALPGVAAVAVVGVPDDVLGQAIKAFVVAEPGAELGARDVMKQCAQRLEPLMVPKQVVFVGELPKTASGKIDRKSLREMKDGAS